MSFGLQNQDGDELVRQLRKKQVGHGYAGEGTCGAGNYVYGVVYFYVPFASTPSINLQNVVYYNSSNIEIWKSSKHAFIVRALVTADGGAGMEFDWSAEI